MSRLSLFGYVAFTVLYVAFYVVLVLGLAGSWRWTEGWIFLAIFDGMIVAITVLLMRRDPELLRQRFGSPFQEGQPASDKVLLMIITVMLLGWISVMPLDAVRFGWSPPFPAPLKVVGGIGLFLAAVLLYRVFRENTFLIPVVRVQQEREQHVVSSGLYGVVRHPMYMAIVLMVVFAPLLLGSLAGLAAGFGLAVVLAIRIQGEEALLLDELEGYADYRKHVRYRLIPRVY